MATLTFNATTDNYLSHESGDVVMFTGNDDTMSFSQCGQTSIVSTGNDQTIYVSQVGSCNDNLTTLGHNTTLVFNDLFSENMMASADFTVWGFHAAFGDHVTLLPPQSATQMPDGQGGTFLTIGTTGVPTSDSTIHFMNSGPLTITQPPPNTINITDSSGDGGVSYNNSIVNFSGINDALGFDKCTGSTFIATGTNQNLAADFAGMDTIADHGQGLTLSFFALSGLITVDDFASDLTGRVIVKTDVGQTASMSSDGNGGTMLALSGQYGGTVDFANDPMSNLAAHLVTNA